MTDDQLLDLLMDRKRGSGVVAARRLSDLAGTTLDREALYKWRERKRIAVWWRPYVIKVLQDDGQELPVDILLPPRRARQPQTASA